MKPFKPDANKWYVIVDWTRDSEWNDFAGQPIDYISTDGFLVPTYPMGPPKCLDTKEEAIAFMLSVVDNTNANWVQKLRVVSGKEIIVMLVKHRIRMASR